MADLIGNNGGRTSRREVRGAMIDRAFGLLTELVGEVRGLREEWAEAPAERRRHIERLTMVAPGGGGDVSEDVYLPVGTAWMIRRVTTSCGTGGGCVLYLDENRPENAIHVQDSPQFGSADLGAGIYVPDGARLIVRFFSQPASQFCAINLRADELVEGE